MSTIRNALNNWLQRQNISVMRQEATICDRFPPNIQAEMIDVSIRSTLVDREKGAPITHDYTLGKVRTGLKDRVPIPRPEGTIGTYHTHPYGLPFPSQHDTVDILNKDDKVMCVGATGKAGTKIQCFTPNKPQYSTIQFKFRLLADDIKDYNIRLGRKYKPRGTRLRRLMESIGSPTYPEEVQYVTTEEIDRRVAETKATAKRAEEYIKVAEVKSDRAIKVAQEAQAELEKAIAPEDIKKARMDVHRTEEEAKLALARLEIEKEHARAAASDADAAVFSAETIALGRSQVITENKDATEHLQEGINLAQRRGALLNEIKSQLRELAAPKEWMAQKWINGFADVPYFEAHPNMFNKCRIIWETFKEELPYEL